MKHSSPYYITLPHCCIAKLHIVNVSKDVYWILRNKDTLKILTGLSQVLDSINFIRVDLELLVWL